MTTTRLFSAAVLLVAGALLAPPAQGQQSASFDLEEHTFNSGGNPHDGAVVTSASFQITLDAVGTAVRPAEMSSSSYGLTGGFVGTYPPPGEVLGMTLGGDKQTLAWNPERSAGIYNLYRDTLGALTGGGYGQCFQQDLADTTATDTATPPAAEGYFYLVTVGNRLAEEGTKGPDSAGSECAGTACP